MQLSFCHPEFEKEVREQINIFDRAITDNDVLSVVELDLSNFNFKEEDIDTLFFFINLKSLSINLGSKDQFFWDHFRNIENLYWVCWGSKVDFRAFSNMKKLSSLCISGGAYSDIAFENLDALVFLENLQCLELHEFGHVDLSPLSKMLQLKSFALRYTHQAESIATIGMMVWLKELVLDGLYVENLDFLDTLPDTVSIEMCGIEIYGCNDVNVEKWKRFKKRDICEIAVKNEWWYYIDLSPLDE